MMLNFNDPHSIAAWLAVYPTRHLALLRALWRLQPQWREFMNQAAQIHQAQAQAQEKAKVPAR